MKLNSIETHFDLTLTLAVEKLYIFFIYKIKPVLNYSLIHSLKIRKLNSYLPDS